MPQRLSRLGGVLTVPLLALSLAALACNLRIGGDESPVNPPIDDIDRPTVTILEPIEDARYTQGQTVSVLARATSEVGITLVELLVNGVRVDSQPPAEGPLPVLDVILDYRADQVGEVVLMVRAYSSNNVPSQLVERRITVLGQIDPGGGGAALTATPNPFQTSPPLPTNTPTPYNPTCRARINAGGLRFRTGPDTNYDIITNFQGGEEPTIQGYAQRPDGVWWKLFFNGQSGWAFAEYTEQLGNCALIQPAAVPASPTPVITKTPQPATPTPTPALPDLQLSVLTGPRELTLGAEGSIQANFPIQVINNGGQTSGTFRIGVVKPDGQTDYYDAPSLNPGGTYDLGGPGGLVITFTLEGVNRVLVTVDPDGTILESNNDNNQAYLDVIVRGPDDAESELGQ